jgi:CRISPR-associated endonuclease Csn1
VAAIGEWEVQRLTRSYQEWEQQGLARPLRQVDPPWGDPASFRREVQQAYDDVFVARPERRRARGEGHAATIRQMKERDSALVVYERKAIAEISEKRLEDIKDPERNQGVIEAIRQWIADGRPTDRLPRSPAGDQIRKVRLRTKGKPAVQVRGGSADRGEIVRVDVFAKPNKRGKDEFYLVPIYPHHVMNKREWPTPPMRAVVAYKDEEEWTLIDSTFSFRFSLYPRNFVEVVKSTGEVFEGYFGGVDRSTGAVSLFAHNSTKNSFRGLGAKTLLTMKKYNVDRFGVRSEVKSEVRTWHGVACTSPILPG